MGLTPNGTVRCPRCGHDTGQIPGTASVTFNKEDPMPSVNCGSCQGIVMIPGTPQVIPGLDASKITMSSYFSDLAKAFDYATDALAQLPPAMIGPASMTQNTGPPQHPADCPGDHLTDGQGNVISCYLDDPPVKRPAAPKSPPGEPTRPTRELIFDDDDGWEADQ